VEFDRLAAPHIMDNPEATQRMAKGNIALAIILEDLLMKPDLKGCEEGGMVVPPVGI